MTDTQTTLTSVEEKDISIFAVEEPTAFGMHRRIEARADKH